MEICLNKVDDRQSANLLKIKFVTKVNFRAVQQGSDQVVFEKSEQFDKF